MTADLPNEAIVSTRLTRKGPLIDETFIAFQRWNLDEPFGKNLSMLEEENPFVGESERWMREVTGRSPPDSAISRSAHWFSWPKQDARSTPGSLACSGIWLAGISFTISSALIGFTRHIAQASMRFARRILSPSYRR